MEVGVQENFSPPEHQKFQEGEKAVQQYEYEEISVE
jgi:hypothetical protein